MHDQNKLTSWINLTAWQLHNEIIKSRAPRRPPAIIFDIYGATVKSFYSSSYIFYSKNSNCTICIYIRW